MNLDIGQLKEAATRGLINLIETSRKIFYFFPQEGKYEKKDGFSYEIPKEEQCRSELYRQLLYGNSNLSIELEADLYSSAPSPKTYRIDGEIDMIAFSEKRCEAVLEVKRAWQLAGWNKKALDLDTDLEKIERMMAQLHEEQSENPLYGIVLFLFYQDKEAPKKMLSQWIYNFLAEECEFGIVDGKKTFAMVVFITASCSCH